MTPATTGSEWLQVAGGLKADRCRNIASSGASTLAITSMSRNGITAETPEGSDWEQIPGLLKQVSVNPATNEVWGVNSNDNIFRRVGITSTNYKGVSWQQIAGGLKWVSVGQAGVWGVNSNDVIFYRNETGNGVGTSGITAENPQGTEWDRISGGLKQVSVSATTNHVWGVNANGAIYRRADTRSPIEGQPVTGRLPEIGSAWRQIDGAGSAIDIGSAGVWVIGSSNAPYARQYTQGQSDVDGYGWDRVDGELTDISVGDGVAWGVDANHVAHVRTGISRDAPTGTGWSTIGPLSLRQISVNSVTNEAWAVAPNNEIYYRTGVVHTCGSENSAAGIDWLKIAGSLKFVSTGPAGVWGVNGNDMIYYRVGTNNGQVGEGSSWQLVEGRLAQISSGNGYVWGVNSVNDIYVRLGITLRDTYPALRKMALRIPGKLARITA
ncbi:PREDICTED: tectonin beta-propeller repeat-containing protein-like, partial [Priapulus caudatus]|uniref:Tectonin beta-propeller repeat-containing protein-like n=1 Tax=Priapulus caudatus TaxID=37621 RepID=A0ABM1F550_PRICU